MTKSFIDILFILLCSTIVMLSQSFRLSAIDAAPVVSGSNGISEINADDVCIVVIKNDGLEITNSNSRPVSLGFNVDYKKYIGNAQCVVLIAGDKEISHQKVMEVWSYFSDANIAAKLGAQKAHSD
ncbi:MAG: biopolymer transporter ExbD [Phycisphaerae bacterium]|nr:biopolymer transporter ExbD [Phycisphaerae bacterium]